ncbi:MBL fold metallo-hydrolase [uncultured Clostridium sp.]
MDSAKSDEAEKIILPYLRINNLKVDYYILTHFHSDHNGHLEGQ